MRLFNNPFRGKNSSRQFGPVRPSHDAETPSKLLSQCPQASATPLTQAPIVAKAANVPELWLKDERTRMGLGSFKALGAAYVIADLAAQQSRKVTDAPLEGRTFITASAGNHGLSVAAGARIFGAKSVIYISQTVPESFAERLAQEGATVKREGADYEASMTAATKAAKKNGWALLSDSSWPGYTDLPHKLMEGYLVMGAEIATDIPKPPTHIFLQAGVGGLACAMAAFARRIWGDAPIITIVEPAAAPALFESIKAGTLVETRGPESNMGRLDCKTASMIALAGLAHDADIFMTISDEDAVRAQELLEEADFATTPSGGAGVAGLLMAAQTDLVDLSGDVRALAIISETAEA